MYQISYVYVLSHHVMLNIKWTKIHIFQHSKFSGESRGEGQRRSPLEAEIVYVEWQGLQC